MIHIKHSLLKEQSNVCTKQLHLYHNGNYSLFPPGVQFISEQIRLQNLKPLK